jgi:hypothetical protein
MAVAVLPSLPVGAEEEAAPQKIGVKGEFIRLGYNDEGWVVLGYRVANDSVGEEWLLLDVGITLMSGVKSQKLTRDEVSVIGLDGTSIPLASQKEFSEASLRALDARANRNRDSINYFPTGANTPCRIGFFTDVSQPGRGMAYDTVELSSNRACVGRLYFHVPAGIQYGRYFLNVQFDGSAVQVPFGIMTKEELKENKKKWKELQKQMKEQQKQQGG